MLVDNAASVEKAVDSLIKVLNNEEDDDVRLSVVNAIGQIGSQTGIDALTNVLNDEDYGIRNSAEDALKNKAGSDKIGQMWRLLQNDISDTKNIIVNIQNRCKFYNHDIFHSPQVENE